VISNQVIRQQGIRERVERREERTVNSEQVFVPRNEEETNRGVWWICSAEQRRINSEARRGFLDIFFGEPKKTNRSMKTGMGSHGEASWKKDARKEHQPSRACKQI
jgi:hypothetical protein